MPREKNETFTVTVSDDAVHSAYERQNEDLIVNLASTFGASVVMNGLARHLQDLNEDCGFKVEHSSDVGVLRAMSTRWDDYLQPDVLAFRRMV